MTDFGKRLKQLRKESGMTQKLLAKRIWVTKATISNYELYERTPAPEILINLSKVFHVSIDYLLGVEDKKRTLDISDLTDEEIQFLEKAVFWLEKSLDSIFGRDKVFYLFLTALCYYETNKKKITKKLSFSVRKL